jgi:hypothetical protein
MHIEINDHTINTENIFKFLSIFENYFFEKANV